MVLDFPDALPQNRSRLSIHTQWLLQAFADEGYHISGLELHWLLMFRLWRILLKLLYEISLFWRLSNTNRPMKSPDLLPTTFST